MNEYEDAVFPLSSFLSNGITIMTGHGIVWILEFVDFTIMHYAAHGKWYRRSWKRSFANRTIITLAKRFAAEKGQA